MNIFSLRKGMLAALFCAVSFFNFSQNTVRCYTDEMHQQLLQEHPELESREQFESWMQSSVIQQQSMAIIGGVYYIPVVVHVIHNGEAVGTATNVSFAAIQSQIDVLNEDFRRMLGSNGWNTHPDGADTKIEFCLAQRRPDGSAFPVGEPGVNRINRTTAGFTTPPFTTTYIDATIKPWTYNNNIPTATRGWDPAKYMNIWLCNISGGILGYAQFPQSPLGGMGCGTPAAATDGVVFLYNSIGKSSVTGFTGVYNEGRTATHEIGHWLGLRHIWGDGGCTVDDFCNDTPEAAAANFGCPVGTNSCTAAPDAGPDMIENYMDYTDDLCMNIFTNDQKMRMRTVLENSPLRVSLINSDACTPPNANDASVVNITNPKGDNCPGSITPNVTLRNRGSSNLTSATISYKIDNGTATTFAWTGSLTPGSTANVALPAFTTTLGQHTFKAYSTLPNGAADAAAVYDTSAITFTISNGINAPFTENFDGSVFPPDVRWVVENVNNDCYTWVGASAVSSTGVFNNNAAQFPGFGNSSASTENLITPIFTLPCNATAANLQFDVAYRRRNSTTANYERLYVEISEDCGTTWNATPVYDKSGTTLQVLTTTLTTYYQPVGITDWRTETINLLPFVTTVSKNVKFRIRAVAANGNNIYIDNLKFNATTPGEINVTQATTTVLDEGAYSYGSVGSGSSSTATFTITNTGTSNLVLTGPINVTGTGFALGSTFGTTTVAAGATTTFTVVFSPAAGGSYTGNVSFGTNDCDEPIYNFVLTGAAAILPPVASFTATPLLACVGSPVTFTNTSTNATTYSWNFGASASPSTSTLANPTVTFTAAGTYTIALTATGAGGSNTQTSTNYITVVSSTGAALPLTQGFTTATFPPTGWSIVNANASPTTWARSATVGFAPTAGNSMVFNNFTYNDGDDDEVRLTGVNMVGYGTAQLQFDVAYAPFNATRFDGLEVLVSTDCGATFTSVYSKSNTVLATAPATTASFTPTTTQWRTETVNLTPYVGNSKVIVAFKNLSGNGNRLFVDNINLTAVPPTAPPVASFTPSVTTVCAGQTVTFNNTSTGSPTSYSWTFGGGTPATSTATSPVVTFNTAGTYTVALTATNASGSNTSNQANIITVNVVPTLTSTNQTVCAGSPATLTATGSPAGGTYAWSTGGTGSSVTVSPTATTPYTVTYTANGCTSTASTSTATVNALPTLTSTNQTVCAGSPATITATGSPAGGTYAWSTGGTGSSVTVSPTATTPYTVTYTANGCTSTTSTSTVTVNALPTLTSTNQTICAGSPATLTATGTPAGGTYAWSTGGTGSSVTVSPTGTTPYTVTYTANGCTSTTSTSTVTVNALPTLTSTNQTICAGSPATLTATGTPAGGTYAWSTGGTGSSVTVSPTGTTPYTVTYTANGCASTASTSTVTVNPTPTITSTNQSVCAGSPATLTATGSPAGGTYAWSTGGTGSSVTVSPTATTPYTVTYTANGCTSTASTSTVTVNPTPTVTSTNQSVCAGSSATLTATGSPAGGTYAWSTGGTGSSVTVSPTATTPYTVTYTANGCASTASTSTVTVNALPTLTSTNQTVCAGSPATITATGSPAGGTYAWSTGGTGSSVTVSPTATTPYTVTYTANGCTSTASTSTVTVNPTPTITSTNQSVCAGSPATLTATGSPAGGTYAWSTGGTGSSVTVSPTATTPYTVTYTANGCTSTASTSTVTVNPTPTVTSTNQSVCAGSPATLTATGSPAGGTYAWSTGGTGSSVTVSPTATTPYTVTYTANGCASTASTSTVTVNALPTLTSTNQTVCAGSPATITATGSPAGGTYAWSTGGTGSSVTVSPTATTPYTVTYTANGCTSTASTSTVTVNPTPTITSTNQTVCAGSPATLTATGTPAGGTYAWSNGGTGSSITINPSATTPYTVTYTANGCTSAASTSTVTVDVVPTVDAGLDTTLCVNALPVILSATSPNSGVTFLWNTTETTSQITVSAAGAYIVQVTLNGCSSSDTVVVIVDPCSGIVENTMGISLYPNPTTGKLNIVSEQQVEASIEVLSLDGKVVLYETINGTTKVLDLSTLTVGTYMLRLNEASNTTIFRVIKD